MGGFTVQDGLSFVKGIRAVEDNRRARDLEQKNKDIDTVIDLLDKRGKVQDPNAIRQYDQQISGYSPHVVIPATAQWQAMRKDDYEAKLSDAKGRILDTLPKVRSAETLMKTGETGRAMQEIDEIMTKNLPNGFSYKTVQNKEGGWEQQIFNSKGELTRTNVINPQDQIDMAVNLMKSPGDAFELISKERKGLEMDNVKNMMNYKTYVNKKTGEEVYVWDQTDMNGKHHQIVQDGKYNAVKDFKPTDYELKKTDKERLEEEKTKAETEKAKKLGGYYGVYEEERSQKIEQKGRVDTLRKVGKKFLDSMGSDRMLDDDGKIYKYSTDPATGEQTKEVDPDSTKQFYKYVDGLGKPKGLGLNQSESRKDVESKVKKKHPHYKTLVGSKEFTSWMLKHTPDEQKFIKEVLDKGSAEQISNVLELYKKQAPKEPDVHTMGF